MSTTTNLEAGEVAVNLKEALEDIGYTFEGNNWDEVDAALQDAILIKPTTILRNNMEPKIILPDDETPGETLIEWRGEDCVAGFWATSGVAGWYYDGQTQSKGLCHPVIVKLIKQLVEENQLLRKG